MAGVSVGHGLAVTYALAYLLMSVCAGVLWFCFARSTEDDDDEQQLHGAGASESTERIRAIYGQRALPDARDDAAAACPATAPAVGSE